MFRFFVYSAKDMHAESKCICLWEKLDLTFLWLGAPHVRPYASLQRKEPAEKSQKGATQACNQALKRDPSNDHKVMRSPISAQIIGKSNRLLIKRQSRHASAKFTNKSLGGRRSRITLK